MDEIAGSGSRLTFGGLATGLDTGAIIDALLDAERRPITLLQNRKSALESEQSALGSLNTAVLSLFDAARDIDNRTSLLSGATLEEEFLAYKATSGDERLLEVEVTGEVTPGSFELEVGQIATVGRNISAAFAGPDEPVATAAGFFWVTYGDGRTINVPVASGDTLSTLRDGINSETLGNDGSIRATLLDDGTGTRLVISGSETGADNDLQVFTSLTGPLGGAFIDEEQDAVDARLTYLGVSVTRPTNDIADLVPGVSLRLRGETEANTPIEVTVSRDDEVIEGRLQALVDAYNSIQSFTNKQAEIDPDTNRGGVLIGDTLVRSVEARIRRTLFDRYDFGPDNPFQSIADIGVKLTEDGLLSLDGETLRSALDLDPNSVRELLSGSGEGETRQEGVASAIGLAIDEITKPDNDFFAAREEGDEDRIEAIERQIERLELRLVDREEFLVRQFSQLESLISTIRAQSGFLGGQ